MVDRALGYGFSLRRGQTQDGPGLRTSVFMKGCPLTCAWCHNPESLTARPEVWWLDYRCIDCGKCDEVCPNGATLTGLQVGHQPDRDVCTGCGICVEACPAKAREQLRSEWSVKELVNEVMRDQAFFDGGGVTVSGGEPAIQPAFVAELLAACKTEGLHTALDTCGAVPWKAMDSILPHCDLILYDLKIMDPQVHKRWTGKDNRNVLNNLRRLATMNREKNQPALWVRTPLIPGATDNEANISAIGEFIRTELGSAVERWELCAFNNLCNEKYQRLGLTWEFADAPLLEVEHAKRLLAVARAEVGTLAGRVILKGGLMKPAHKSSVV